MGGETVTAYVGPGAEVGLSPRGRGNLHSDHLSVTPSGSIPAWAGKPAKGMSAILPAGVYPRVGGETLRMHG